MAEIIMFPTQETASAFEAISKNFSACFDAVKGTPGEYALNSIIAGLAIIADGNYKLSRINSGSEARETMSTALEALYQAAMSKPNAETNLFSIESIFYCLSRFIYGN